MRRIMNFVRMLVTPPFGEETEPDADDPLRVAGVLLEEAELVLGIRPVELAWSFPALKTDLDPDHHDLGSCAHEVLDNFRIIEGATGRRGSLQRMIVDKNGGYSAVYPHFASRKCHRASPVRRTVLN